MKEIEQLNNINYELNRMMNVIDRFNLHEINVDYGVLRLASEQKLSGLKSELLNMNYDDTTAEGIDYLMDIVSRYEPYIKYENFGIVRYCEFIKN